MTLLSLLTVLALAQPVETPLPQEPEPEVRNVAVVVFSGVELLDFAGPGEVFAAARTDAMRPFRVYTVAHSTRPIVSQGFVRITPRYTFEDCPEPDVIVMPGGGVPTSSPSLRRFLRKGAESSEVVLSVCNGAGALAAAGLLEGLTVTTHRGSLEWVKLLEPTATVLSNRRYVDNGKIVTSAGVSAGIDGALHVVARLYGDEVAARTARYMEYEWRPEEIARLHAEPGVEVDGAGLRELQEELRAHGPGATLATYRRRVEAKQEVPSEARMNSLGYALMSRGRVSEAEGLFRLVAAAFPTSANAHDSLSDVCEMLGKNELAVANAERALELVESSDGMAERMRVLIRESSEGRIRRIRDGVGRGDFACPPCGLECDGKRHESEGQCPDCGMELVRVVLDAGEVDDGKGD